MKNLIYGIAALVLVFFAISACNKYGNLPGGTGKLVASSYKVDINQPDSLLLSGAKTTDTVHWSVSPAGFDSIITKNNVAEIFFKKAGVYKVLAIDPPLSPASVSITVLDSVYRPVTTYSYLPLTGDQITLVPHFYNNPTADSSYLSFVAQTKKSYCGISKLVVADSLINNKYGVNFLYVSQPSPCVIGQSPIAAVINFTQNLPVSLPNGTFPLSVTLNNTTYTGSIVVTSSNITFNWNYTSGVIISPMQISR
jgi:hypothetical protein